MEIPNPRRILILSPPSAILTPLLNALIPPPPPSNPPSTPALNPTPSPPPSTQNPDPTPNLIHHITTPYYRASIPVWTDTISAPSAWKHEWLSLPGADAVVSSIGAWIVGFAYPLQRDDLDGVKVLLRTVADVLQQYTHGNYEIDADAAALFAVVLPRGEGSGLRVAEEEWEDVCGGCGGWEFIDGSGPGAEGGRNEFGETTGLPRLLEALATNDWDSGAADALSPELDLDFDLEDDDDGDHEQGTQALLEDLEGPEHIEMHAPMLPRASEPRSARNPSGKREDAQERRDEHADGGAEGPDAEDGGAETEDEGAEREVEALQGLLLKMQAVKDASADLPAAERRKMARRAVRDVMRGV